jgi:hypothetical protein
MRRGLIIAIYALGGLGIALSLSFATFALAGQELSDPANPVHPIAAPTTGASTSPSKEHGSTASDEPTHSPQPGTLAPAPSGGSSTSMSTGFPEKPGHGSGSTSPSPAPGDNGGGGGDDGGGGGDD